MLGGGRAVLESKHLGEGLEERCFWGGTKLPSVGMGLGSGRRERVSSSEQFMVGMVGLGFLLLGRRLKLFLLTWSLGCKYGPYLWE